MFRENVLRSASDAERVVLLWSRRFEHLQRVSLGYQGYGVHLLQSRGEGKVQMLSLFADSATMSSRLFKSLRLLYVEWARIRSMLVPETETRQRATFEDDKPIFQSIRTLLQRMNALSKSESDLGNPLLTRVVIIQKDNTRLHRFLFCAEPAFAFSKWIRDYGSFRAHSKGINNSWYSSSMPSRRVRCLP